VREGLETTLAAATHLTALDDAAVEAARALADKIDMWDQIVVWATQDAADRQGGRPAVPQHDNVSIPSFFKALHALGLTPQARGVKGTGASNADETSLAVPDEPFDPSSL